MLRGVAKPPNEMFPPLFNLKLFPSANNVSVFPGETGATRVVIGVVPPSPLTRVSVEVTVSVAPEML
jgi:hypothetical protein